MKSSKSVFYYLYQYWIVEADPRARTLPLVDGGPEKILAFMGSYLLFVKVIGPFLMRNKEAFKLRWPMFIYNTFMVVMNFYLFIRVIQFSNYGKTFLDFVWPSPNDFSKETMIKISLLWWVWMTRFLDLLDTVFFVLRKKYSQITFLHLYHHTAVPILGWMCFKINPMIPAIYYFLLFNTFVHTVMYSYYALASFGPSIQKYLWWKKYITIMQLAQFIFCFCYSIVIYFYAQYFPTGFFWIGFAQNPIFFYMFFQFYRQSYLKHARTSFSQQSINCGRQKRLKH